MKKKIGKNEKEFKMMAEWWNLYQKYYIPEDTDEYWTDIHNAIIDFVKKYDSDFAKDLCMAIYDELERRYKQMFKGAIA